MVDFPPPSSRSAALVASAPDALPSPRPSGVRVSTISDTPPTVRSLVPAVARYHPHRPSPNAFTTDSTPDESTPPSSSLPVLAPSPSELLDQIPDAVYYVDRRGRIGFWNVAAEKFTGFTKGEVVSRRCRDNLLSHVDDRAQPLCGDRCPLSAVMIDGQSRSLDAYLHHKNGSRIPVHVKATAVRDERGQIVGALEVFTDNSPALAVKSRIRELEGLALLDPLTGLPNRRAFEASLADGLRQLSAHGPAFGVLLLDLDHFKRINDTFGHAIGDKVLMVVSRTLQANCRTSDIIARWGGEEFAVVADRCDFDALRTLAEKLRGLIARSGLRYPPIGATVSIGGTVVRVGDSAETILARADARLYDAKRRGRNRVAI